MKKLKIILAIIAIVLLVIVVFYYMFPGVAFKFTIKAERSIAGLKQNDITFKGLNIQYLEGGQGEIILFLHGFGANKDNWVRFSKHLTPHFRVIAPDLPGFGESTRDPAASYTISEQADRIHAFVNALKLKAFHLGGNSMGGNIAGVYAARYPKYVTSLCLLAPGGVVSAIPSEMYQQIDAGKPNPLVVEQPEAYDALLDFVFTKRTFIPGAIKHYLTEEAVKNRPLNNVIFQHIQEFKKTSSLEGTLNGFTVPTLIIWGKQDRVLHFSGAKILGSVMPNSQVEVIENMGHLPMIERPKEMAEIYLRFLGTIKN